MDTADHCITEVDGTGIPIVAVGGSRAFFNRYSRLASAQSVAVLQAVVRIPIVTDLRRANTLLRRADVRSAIVAIDTGRTVWLSDTRGDTAGAAGFEHPTSKREAETRGARIAILAGLRFRNTEAPLTGVVDGADVPIAAGRSICQPRAVLRALIINKGTTA